MATTAIGPIRESRINQTLFVGETGIPTIQAAVNFAVNEGGSFIIAIPFGYAGTDSIAAIVNGSVSVVLIDKRGATMQAYTWSAGAYRPADFVQLGPVRAEYCAGEGDADIPSLPIGSIVIDFSNPVGRLSAKSVNPEVAGIQLIGINNDGSRVVVYMECAEPTEGNQIIGFYAPLQINDGVAGDLNVSGDLTADAAAFNDCDVSGSPVRTFANTPDAPAAPTYPPAGIGISTGTAWESTSIDPATVPLTDQENTFTGDQTINGDLIVPAILLPAGCEIAGDGGGSLLVDSVAPGGVLLNWNSGNRVAFGDGAGNQVAIVDNTGAAAFSRLISPIDLVMSASVAATTRAQLRAAAPDLLVNPSDSTGGIYLTWDKGTGGTWFGNGAGASVGHVSGTGTAVFNGNLFAKGFAQIGTNNLLTLGEFSTSSTKPAIGATGAYMVLDAGPQGAVQFNNSSGDAVQFCGGDGSGHPVAVIDKAGNATFAGTLAIAGTLRMGARGDGSGWGAGVCNLNSDGTNLFVQSQGGAVYLNWDRPGATNFGNGTGGAATTIDAAGNVTCASITAPSKNFRIPHPLDDERDLMHSCLEGPEMAVYYRGEAKTKNGRAEVELPDYFEALTRTAGRTVQLTLKVDDDNPVFGGQVAAGSVKDGHFKVYSTDPSVTVYWEVKAIRADQPELEIVIAKREQVSPLIPAQPEPAPKKRNGRK